MSAPAPLGTTEPETPITLDIRADQVEVGDVLLWKYYYSRGSAPSINEYRITSVEPVGKATLNLFGTRSDGVIDHVTRRRSTFVTVRRGT